MFVLRSSNDAVQPLPHSLAAVSGIVIGRDGQQTDEGTFTVGHSPARPGDTQAVERINAGRRRKAGNFLPMQSLVTVDLILGELE